jgi:2-polyprenyl-3-methyl-5-hydroxy-6-metoxy-1,4-benzoquinol methylase
VEAITQAAPVADERTVFAVAEAGGFQSDRRFDVIVFSQILNYVQRPDRILARYANLLEPNGRFVVSMYGSGRTHAAWRLIEKTMTVEDTMAVTQVAGTTTTKVLKPRG